MALEYSGRSTEVEVDNRVSLVNLETLDAKKKKKTWYVCIVCTTVIDMYNIDVIN